MGFSPRTFNNPLSPPPPPEQGCLALVGQSCFWLNVPAWVIPYFFSLLLPTCCERNKLRVCGFPHVKIGRGPGLS